VGVTDDSAGSVEDELRDAGNVERVVDVEVVDVGVYPARRAGRVEVNGHTTLIADTVAETVGECRQLLDVVGVDAVLFNETGPRNTGRCTQITHTPLQALTCTGTDKSNQQQTAKIKKD